MPFVTPRLEVITMGKSTVVNASKSVMPYVKQKFRNKSSYEILTDKLVYGANPYYLPDIEHIKPMENAACSFVLLDKDLHGLYKNKGFSNALQYVQIARQCGRLAWMCALPIAATASG